MKASDKKHYITYENIDTYEENATEPLYSRFYILTISWNQRQKMKIKAKGSENIFNNCSFIHNENDEQERNLIENIFIAKKTFHLSKNC